MGYMLEIQNIHKTFNPGTINEKVALNGVNLNLNPGDFVTIIGGNGAGKSTSLMNCLSEVDIITDELLEELMTWNDNLPKELRIVDPQKQN